MMNSHAPALILCTWLMLGLYGCTSVTIDETHQVNPRLQAGESVVLLGRRHASDYETEPDLVSCIGDVLSAGSSGIQVVPEQEFIDNLYPWFEPRTAPMSLKQLNRLVEKPQVAQQLSDYNVEYIIWLDGNTETTNRKGSITCSIAPGGAGCFGFGTWENQSDYEAMIWDYRQRQEVGKISVDASGTSYMPAVIIPIPIIARVQDNACKGIGTQLRNILAPAEQP